MTKDELKLTVRSREGILFSDTVKSVTAVNDSGRFDILPLHANFITLITDELTIFDNTSKKHVIPLRNAILRVKENTVDVLLGIKNT